MKRMLAGVLLVGLVMWVGALAAQEPKPESKPTAKAAEKEKNVVTTESGLKYEDLVVGTGAMPKAGQTVRVHYTGWLTNEKQFDSSRGRDNTMRPAG